MEILLRRATYMLSLVGMATATMEYFRVQNAQEKLQRRVPQLRDESMHCLTQASLKDPRMSALLDVSTPGKPFSLQIEPHQEYGHYHFGQYRDEGKSNFIFFLSPLWHRFDVKFSYYLVSRNEQVPGVLEGVQRALVEVTAQSRALSLAELQEVRLTELPAQTTQSTATSPAPSQGSQPSSPSPTTNGTASLRPGRLRLRCSTRGETVHEWRGSLLSGRIIP